MCRGEEHERRRWQQGMRAPAMTTNTRGKRAHAFLPPPPPALTERYAPASPADRRRGGRGGDVFDCIAVSFFGSPFKRDRTRLLEATNGATKPTPRNKQKNLYSLQIGAVKRAGSRMLCSLRQTRILETTKQFRNARRMERLCFMLRGLSLEYPWL